MVVKEIEKKTLICEDIPKLGSSNNEGFFKGSCSVVWKDQISYIRWKKILPLKGQEYKMFVFVFLQHVGTSEIRK